ncbi:MAG: DUF72 domain-containing protein [Candidatus Krumholzibacteriales bacterium]
MSERGNIRIGTSGWNYRHWRENFYPPEIKQKDWLEFYAGRFDTVEINNSFYNLPSAGTFRNWADTVPDNFLFAVKASRYITHMKKLKDPGEPVANFMDNAGHLGNKLGPVLFQLPPRWNVNAGRLKQFLDELPSGVPAAFEFRDSSWWDDRIYSILKDYGAAFCIYHLAGRESPRELTADFVYIRLHGPKGAYQGRYRKQGLGGWAGAALAWAEAGKDVYIYFDNDQNGYAPVNAAELKEMTEE